MLKKLVFAIAVVLLAGVVLALIGWPLNAAAQNPDPNAPTYSTSAAAYYPLERGFMFWLEEADQIYVLVNQTNELGGYVLQYADTWQEGMPETDPSLVPPPGLQQPDRGFGLVWRSNPNVRNAVGWGIGGTHGYTALVVRHGNRTLISAPDNRVYDITGGTWQAVDYYYRAQ
ncbi:MAG: hypothetical protein GYB65_13945 [Chloroflexi bacterium]|nr:hypothetical protein [Chloroflexota bacterium]